MRFSIKNLIKVSGIKSVLGGVSLRSYCGSDKIAFSFPIGSVISKRGGLKYHWKALLNINCLKFEWSHLTHNDCNGDKLLIV